MRNIILMYTNLDKNNKLLIIIICIIIALLVIIGIANFISNSVNKRKYKKQKELNLELEKEEIKVEQKVEEVKPDIQIQREETKEEIINNYQREVKDEMEEIETLDENVSDIDEILLEMMSVSTQEEFDLTDFEREQEENAIISYSELCKKAGVEEIVYPKKEINKEVEQKITNEVYRNNNYKPSTYISPIYGVQKEEVQVDEDSEFLGKLKEFRSGL